ncbi:hypothetical protein [Fructobacillus evanidus]|uniref:Uncharacterized protein n=1 Tax=Fructobacillus evanidus TaxID=3064281 RepID=A0ABM9MWZ5_9LACO|nr:unnamed protein product [Fructobacillus sp. LMG 32999]CAK1229882.1 unnamed protein product [Fructobacillus sp. LMG 32999]CAK1230757.1 unnamed protein product [Fructobacillus sp. LMG 32999]CAK1230826.1 unnamed protein product [Fructobacillus sp. LMG 32999]CAK1231961.1 unnamed protein product [Fructobacillus sp. LMG 32999]
MIKTEYMKRQNNMNNRLSENDLLAIRAEFDKSIKQQTNFVEKNFVSSATFNEFKGGYARILKTLEETDKRLDEEKASKGEMQILLTIFGFLIVVATVAIITKLCLNI